MRTILASAALALVASPLAAQQQMRCLPHAELEAVFADRQVYPSGHGLTNGQMVTLWIAPDDSFAITLTSPQGVACIAAMGVGWYVPERPAQGVPG